MVQYRSERYNSVRNTTQGGNGETEVTMKKLGNTGRVLVVFGAMAVTTVGAFGGSAFAARGTVKTADLGATNAGQDPHLDTACVALNLANFDSAPAVTFQLVAPTAAGDAVSVSPNSKGGYSIEGLFQGVAPAAQGYHVKVDAGGKTKVFWVDADAAGCESDVHFF